ncbi:hypothetical protein [Nocardioides nanhaiensis]|uniref:Uncharacterized protein n=1 Tax=Nocardioides nanhaiensis TaxID=1476871 RepID=A0ABP8VR32_9ACTN
MTSAAALADAVRRATAETPYTVVDETPGGFAVQIDVADQQWWTLLHRKSLRKSFKHVVAVHEAAGTYTVTDQSLEVAWEAGADVSGGLPRPTLQGSVSAERGLLVEKSFRKEYGVDDQGEVGAVVDYSFDSREGNRLIDAQARQLGLSKKLNPTAKVGLVVAGAVLLGLLVSGIVLVVLLLVN